MRTITVAISVVSAIVCANPASAVYHKIGGFASGDMVMDVSAGSGYALVAGGYGGFRVLDTSDPSNPTPLYSYATEGPAWRVIEHQSRAYVIDWWRGMLVFDMSDPTTPELLGQSPEFNLGYAALIEGNLAYVGTNTSLRCMDVSDPAHITLLHVFGVDDGIRSLQKKGNTMYAAGWGAGVLMIDVSIPTSFGIQHVIDTIDRAYAVEVVDDVAFVADGWAGVLAIDISDPVHPVMLCQYPIPGCVQWLHVEGSVAYVTDLQCGFHVLDISDPANITAIESYHIPGEAQRAAVRDGLTYVADSDLGMHILDIHDPVNPMLVGAYGEATGANEARVSDHVAFLADEYDGLVLVDVATPSLPKYLAGINLDGAERCVDVENTRVVCGTDRYGGGNLEFFTTLPGTPIQHTASYIAPGAVAAVTLQDAICYAVALEDDYGAVECVKVGDPYHPQFLSRTMLEPWLSSVCVDGEYVLCALRYDGLRVYDFTNPSVPALIGQLDTPGSASAISVAGDYAYVADGGGGLQIVDLTEPQNPAWVGTLRPHADSAFYTKPEVSGNLLYVEDYNWNTIYTYDITEPTAPVLVDEDAWNCRSLSLCAADGLLYTANAWAGLSVLDLRAVSAVAQSGASGLWGTEPGTAEPGGACPDVSSGLHGVHLNIANPFRGAARVTFRIEGEAAPSELVPTQLAIFDATGRRVSTLVETQLRPGVHSAIWQGKDEYGRSVPAGSYYCALRCGTRRATAKVILVK
jgi:hypothetical protein